MDEFVRRRCAHLRSRPAPIVRQGPVGQVIRDQVEHLRRDLPVVGTHGCGGIACTVLGSVAEHLVSRSPCDVLAVRP